jgi:hypothetical protein
MEGGVMSGAQDYEVARPFVPEAGVGVVVDVQLDVALTGAAELTLEVGADERTASHGLPVLGLEIFRVRQLLELGPVGVPKPLIREPPGRGHRTGAAGFEFVQKQP